MRSVMLAAALLGATSNGWKHQGHEVYTKQVRYSGINCVVVWHENRVGEQSENANIGCVHAGPDVPR